MSSQKGGDNKNTDGQNNEENGGDNNGSPRTIPYLSEIETCISTMLRLVNRAVIVEIGRIERRRIFSISEQVQSFYSILLEQTYTTNELENLSGMTSMFDMLLRSSDLVHPYRSFSDPTFLNSIQSYSPPAQDLLYIVRGIISGQTNLSTSMLNSRSLVPGRISNFVTRILPEETRNEVEEEQSVRDMTEEENETETEESSLYHNLQRAPEQSVSTTYDRLIEMHSPETDVSNEIQGQQSTEEQAEEENETETEDASSYHNLLNSSGQSVSPTRDKVIEMHSKKINVSNEIQGQQSTEEQPEEETETEKSPLPEETQEPTLNSSLSVSKPQSFLSESIESHLTADVRVSIEDIIRQMYFIPPSIEPSNDPEFQKLCRDIVENYFLYQIPRRKKNLKNIVRKRSKPLPLSSSSEASTIHTSDVEDNSANPQTAVEVNQTVSSDTECDPTWRDQGCDQSSSPVDDVYKKDCNIGPLEMILQENRRYLPEDVLGINYDKSSATPSTVYTSDMENYPDKDCTQNIPGHEDNNASDSSVYTSDVEDNGPETDQSNESSVHFSDVDDNPPNIEDFIMMNQGEISEESEVYSIEDVPRQL